jgi:hypothetical protein
MAVRSVTSRGRNIVGRFPSLKVERMVAFESLIEQDFLYVLDYERDVTTFAEQPLVIKYCWQGKTRHYTPDFLVVRGQRHELVECKLHARLHTEENQRKFTAARQWCQEIGWTFTTVTDQELRSGPRLENIKLLTRYARLEVAPAVVGCAIARLHEHMVDRTLMGLAHLLTPDDPRQGVAVLLHLAFHHRLHLPITATPIAADTEVSFESEV